MGDSLDLSSFIAWIQVISVTDRGKNTSKGELKSRYMRGKFLGEVCEHVAHSLQGGKLVCYG
jgi:hypothetical protein